MSAIIFDFDGTISDSFDFVVNLLATAAHQPPPTAEQRLKYRGMSMFAIGRGYGHSWLKLLRLFINGRQQMGLQIRKTIHPYKGMPELIKKLNEEGHQLYILTSNTVYNVRLFLKHYELKTYFLQTYGSIGVFGKSSALRRLLNSNHLDIKDAVYVGDELRDVQAAHSLNLRVVAVTWGFTRSEALAEARPTAVAHNPQELLNILEEM